MICVKCDLDLAKCICSDLEQRFEAILKSEYVHIGSDYQQRVRKHIEDTKHDQAKAE